METTNDTFNPIRTWDDALRALRSNNAERIAMAGEVCAFAGPLVSRLLVRELARTKNRPAFRVRVANVLERIGELDRPIDLCDLMSVVHADKHAEVRDATARVLAALRAGKPGAMSAEQMIDHFRELREFRLGNSPPYPAEQDEYCPPDTEEHEVYCPPDNDWYEVP